MEAICWGVMFACLTRQVSRPHIEDPPPKGIIILDNLLYIFSDNGLSANGTMGGFDCVIRGTSLGYHRLPVQCNTPLDP